VFLPVRPFREPAHSFKGLGLGFKAQGVGLKEMFEGFECVLPARPFGEPTLI